MTGSKAAVQYVTAANNNPFAAKGVVKFLFVESKGAVPGGHRRGVDGMVASGYRVGVDFDQYDYTTLGSALDQLGTVYNAIVVASDHGGLLRQEELDILNARVADIVSFINDGGGIFAMAESGQAGELTTHGRFEFLPFAVSGPSLGQSEIGFTVTPFGQSLNLTDADVNGAVSHNIFDGTFGLNVVDVDALNRVMSLAGRGIINLNGIQTPYQYNATAFDPDYDTLRFSLMNAPAGMQIDPTTGVIHWAPGAGQVGIHNVTIKVDDGRGGTATQSYQICVLQPEGNHAPVFVSEPVLQLLPPNFTPSCPVETWSYAGKALDPDGDSVRFALLEAPVDMSIDPESGVVTWIPSIAIGDYPVTIEASDGKGGRVRQSFSLETVMHFTALEFNFEVQQLHPLRTNVFQRQGHLRFGAKPLMTMAWVLHRIGNARHQEVCDVLHFKVEFAAPKHGGTEDTEEHRGFSDSRSSSVLLCALCISVFIAR